MASATWTCATRRCRNWRSDLSTENPTPRTGAAGGIFATTHWTVVLAAGQGGSPQAEVALEELCRTYWYPLYAYVRRHGHAREDA